MNLKPSVAELRKEHMVMELESSDRMYLNAYVPQLTTEAGVAGFVRGYLGHRFASTKQAAEMSESFVESIMQFSLDYKIDLVRFQKGQRKAFGNGGTLLWINYSSANVNFYYFYCLDEEFGPFLSSSAPTFPIRPSSASMATST